MLHDTVVAMSVDANVMFLRKTIIKDVRDVIEITSKKKINEKNDGKKLSAAEKAEQIKLLTAQMKEAAKLLEFEHAAYLRDKIAELKGEK